MTDAPRVPTACDGCGQTDDHPKVLTWGPWQKDDRTSVSDASFHFDCLPPQFEDLLGTDDDAPQHAVTRAAIAKARDGVHGDKLLAFIEKQPSDNDIEVS
jgi:hypothetical protein